MIFYIFHIFLRMDKIKLIFIYFDKMTFDIIYQFTCNVLSTRWQHKTIFFKWLSTEETKCLTTDIRHDWHIVLPNSNQYSQYINKYIDCINMNVNVPHKELWTFTLVAILQNKVPPCIWNYQFHVKPLYKSSFKTFFVWFNLN